MNKIHKQNRNRLIDTENRQLSEGGVGGLNEKGEGIKQRRKLRHRQQYGDCQRKWGMGEAEEGTGGINW